MSHSINVGIIGPGIHGRRYINHIINDISHLNLAAISRRSEEGLQQAQAWQAAYHQDWRDLVNDPNVDAVISVTTPNLNLDIARHCVQAKKALLIEKPLAITAAAASEIAALFEQAGLPLTVSQTLRYNPVIIGLKNALPKAGRIISLHAGHRLERTTHSWLDFPDVAGGGVALHTAVHVFDALRYITQQEIVKIKAQFFSHYTTRLEDVVIAFIEMADGAVGTLDFSKVSPGRSGRYEFVGESGQLHGDQILGRLELIRQTAVYPLPVKKNGPALIPLLNDWAAFLRGNRHNPISGTEGMMAVKICDACARSAAQGDWVTV